MDKDKRTLEEMYDKLSDIDKWRIQNYIFQNIQLPLMIENLKKVGILEKDYQLI